MNERVNDTARDAAHGSDPGLVPCPQCPAPQYVACTSRDPHPLRVIDAALAAALPHLTAEDVPHIAARALRDLADETDYWASAGADGTITHDVASAWLRDRADRYGSADDLPSSADTHAADGVRNP